MMMMMMELAHIVCITLTYNTSHNYCRTLKWVYLLNQFGVAAAAIDSLDRWYHWLCLDFVVFNRYVAWVYVYIRCVCVYTKMTKWMSDECFVCMKNSCESQHFKLIFAIIMQKFNRMVEHKYLTFTHIYIHVRCLCVCVCTRIAFHEFASKT